MSRSIDIDFTGNERPALLSAAFDQARAFLFEKLQPRYAVRIIRSCFIPMRDGTRLSTDFHIPVGAALPLPVVLMRTCYGKNLSKSAFQTLLPEQGFVCAIQDVRGRYESEGEFVACTSADREDGYDTVECISSQCWSNGAVGAMGTSYLGETAAKLAATRHPRHRCSVIMFDGSYSGGNSQNGAYLQGGITLLRMLFGWFRDHVPKVSYGPPPHVDREMWFKNAYSRAYASQPVAQPAVELDAQLRSLPVFDMLDRSGAAPSDFARMMIKAADPSDDYWQNQGFLTDDDRFDTPTIHITGPLERGGSGFDNFRLFRERAVSTSAREHQYLWFTPAAHSQLQLCDADNRVGARHFGDTRHPYYRALIDWFGHWLRGDTSNIEKWPKVRFFLANRNAWCTADTWPPAGTTERRWYLHSDGRANGLDGDGMLSEHAPEIAEPSDTYIYDPADPVPSEPPCSELDLLGGGYADRTPIESRNDVLLYTSPPLPAPVEIVGPITVVLHVSSSARDTDFSVVLTEVYSDGRSINVTHGMARARYRQGLDRQVFMERGKTYRIHVDLWHAAIEFKTGSRIRLEVTSSHFPVFDRNLNTGGDNYRDSHWVVAENTIHHDATRASYVALSVRG